MFSQTDSFTCWDLYIRLCIEEATKVFWKTDRSFASMIKDGRGGVAIIFALALLPVILLAGGAVDYALALRDKSAIQQALDASLLAAAKNGRQVTSYLQNLLNSNLKAQRISVSNATLTTATSSDGSQIYHSDASFAVSTSFLKIVGLQTITVGAHAEVTLSNQTASQTGAPPEIALVLDVSSSMIEQGRFVPMQAAVKSFIDAVSDPATGLKQWKISMTPFSSRINFGIERSDLRTAWNGNPATPIRWTDPTATYSAPTYSKITWVDGKNFAMYNGKNYYWMGCVEPRLDFAVQTSGSTATAIGEASPSTMLFVPMDDNPQSGKSFCPPPITPLSTDASDLKARAAALTSEGSTRLDAGMLGGWYTLSPEWSSAWAAPATPAAYGAARKYVVFMTDGRMNTQNDPTAKSYDWVCEASSTCDTYANDALVSTCSAMKAKGISIFTIAYDQDADVTYIKSCASGDDHFYTASSTASGDTAIKSVYAKIASIIVGASRPLRLSK
jgi:Flp pilus assembly protein TadG